MTACILAITFCSCGRSTLNEASDNYFVTTGYDSNSSMGWAGDMQENVDYDIDEAPADEPSYAPVADVTGNPTADSLKGAERKIIKNKTIDVETLEYEEFVAELPGKVSAFGGYIESSTQNGNTYYSKSMRSAFYKIRIPAENFDEFTTLIGDMASVTYTYEYINDVTTEYVDIEARLAALKAEQESFLKLMDKAETIEEILNIQSYLTNVNYEIESFTAQLNSYKSLVSYSTLSLTVTEVERITPPVIIKPTVWERITQNLSDNLYDIGEDFKDAFVGIVSALPYIGIFAVIVIIAVIIVKLIIRSSRKKAKSTVKAPESESSK